MKLHASFQPVHGITVATYFDTALAKKIINVGSNVDQKLANLARRKKEMEREGEREGERERAREQVMGSS